MLRSSGFARALLIASFALGALSPAGALAQEPTPGEALFVEGRKLMDEGKLDEACARFEKSYALEGALGSLLNLANCEEKRGKLRVALEHWKKAAATAGDQEKNRLYALGRAGALEDKLGFVMVVMGTSVAGAVATIDGEVVALGEKVAVEPGKHVIEVTANGQTQRREVTVDAKETRSVELWAAGPTGSGQRGGAGSGAGTPPAESARTNLAPWGWASLAVGGASAIGFAATGFAILGECPNSECPLPDGKP